MSLCGVLHVLVLEQVLGELRLPLAAGEMSAHGIDHLVVIPRPTLPQRVGFDILIRARRFDTGHTA